MQHLTGALNSIADRELRTWSDRSEWKLNPILFQKINLLLGPLSTDLFASRLSTHLPSWKPDLLAMAVDAFTVDWGSIPGKLCANPPWNLVGRVLSQVLNQRVEELVLVQPVWKAQLWYPVLLQLLINKPLLIPQSPLPIQSVCQNRVPDIMPQLAVWVGARVANFQMQPQTSHGETSPRDHTTPPSANGARWCAERERNPISGPISDVANFLADLFEEGYQYRSINVYRSSISTTHDKVDGDSVGQHPTVTRLMRGVFNKRPPLSKYSYTWDVHKVTSYISNLDDDKVFLKLLSLKLVMLLALTRPSRSSDLSSLDLKYMKVLPDGIQFDPAELAKQSRPSKPVASFLFPAFPSDKRLCPIATILANLHRSPLEVLEVIENLSSCCHMLNRIILSHHPRWRDG